MDRNSRKTNVFYLPVGLTTFQKDLIEILVSLHARSFQEELSSHENTAKKELNGSGIMYPQISSKQMTYMFDDNIRAIANHPCLLVDHYMPRQFLRMEPSENLVNTSEKFKKLQQLLSSFICRDREKFPEVLKIGLISHSVRELDLLEGLILGKRVRIKRLSGTSLYDEKHVYFEQQSDYNQDTRESKDGTPNNDFGSNKYTGYPRDDYDYSYKRQMRHKKRNNDDWLFLTTTTHLINDPLLLNDYDVDYIICFDPLLDPSLPALEHIKVKGQKAIPLIKLLVVDSPDHYILENTFQNESEQYEQLKSSIDHFLRTRHSSHKETCVVDYHQFVNSLLGGDKLLSSLPDIHLSAVAYDRSPFELAMSKLKFSDCRLTIDENVFDMKSYQSELMKRTVDRLMKVQFECKQNSAILGEKREEETERQNRFDEMKADIGITFKKFQENEKIINDSGKRLERAQTEAEKLKERLQMLQKKKTELERLISLKDEQELENARLAYEEQTKGLQVELEELEKVNEQKNSHNNELRGQYQQRSSLAAEQAQRLQILKTSLEDLKRDVSGPAPSIRYESLAAQKKMLEEELTLLKSRTKFLRSYMTKMNNQYDLNSVSNSDAFRQKPSPSSSNNRSLAHNSRYRSTRSNTPTYT